MADNIFSTGMAAFGNAYDTQAKIGQDRARIQAGRALASGDYAGGAATLNSAGMIDEGHNVIADQQQLQDRQATFDATEAKRKAAALIDVAQSLKQVPVGQRQSALMAKLPIFQSLKIDTAPFQGLDEAHLTDDQLDQFSTALGKAADEYTLGDGQQRYRDGKMIAAGGAKHEWKEITNKDGSTSFIDLANPGAAPSASAAPPVAAAPAAQPADASQPRGIRNNNPLNVTVLGGAHKWDGQTGQDGHYAVFATPEQGVAAADKNLQAYAAHHGINTLSGIINRWAPPGENDTGAYVATVSGTLGVDPNTPLNLADPGVRRQVLGAMARVELGKPMPLMPSTRPVGGVLAGGPGADILAPPRGIPGSAPGTKNPNKPPTGYRWNGDKLEAIPGGPADPGGLGGPGNTALHGDDYLNTLPPNQAQQVKAIAEGRMQFPGGFALKSPYWQQMISAVSQYDPTFDAVNYNARAKTRADFTSGKNAQNIKALNTAIGHLGRLDSQISGTSGLGGFPGATWVNSGVNMFERTSGDPGVTNFEQTASALSTELTAVFRGTGGAEADVKRYLDQLNSNGSDAQKKAAVRNIAELLRSRLEAIGAQYEQGMGTTKDPLDLLNPQASATFKRLEGAAPAQGAPAGPAAPRGRPRAPLKDIFG